MNITPITNPVISPQKKTNTPSFKSSQGEIGNNDNQNSSFPSYPKEYYLPFKAFPKGILKTSRQGEDKLQSIGEAEESEGENLYIKSEDRNRGLVKACTEDGGEETWILKRAAQEKGFVKAYLKPGSKEAVWLPKRAAQEKGFVKARLKPGSKQTVWLPTIGEAEESERENLFIKGESSLRRRYSNMKSKDRNRKLVKACMEDGEEETWILKRAAQKKGLVEARIKPRSKETVWLPKRVAQKKGLVKARLKPGSEQTVWVPKSDVIQRWRREDCIEGSSENKVAPYFPIKSWKATNRRQQEESQATRINSTNEQGALHILPQLPASTGKDIAKQQSEKKECAQEVFVYPLRPLEKKETQFFENPAQQNEPGSRSSYKKWQPLFYKTNSDGKYEQVAK